jgi:esterase/lipase superfamily enzyme
MPALSSLALAVVALLAALIVYGLAWRATVSSGRGMRLFVRGGLLLLIAVPTAAMLLLAPALQRASSPEPQLSSPLDDRFGHFHDFEDRSLSEEQAARAPPPAQPPAAPQSDPSGGAGPPPAGLAADEEQAWDVVPVFFGTDREEEPSPERLQYNAERGRRLELGEAKVTVPKSHQVPNIERPWVLQIPYFEVTLYEEEEDPEKHFTMQEIKKLSQDEFIRYARERLAKSNRYRDHALVFVHGYNTSFDHALYRTAQIAYDLKFDGAAFLYSWPSGGAVGSYTYDRESAQASVPYLQQFLKLVTESTGAKSVSIIAHSMGNQPLLEALREMRHSAPHGVAISEVILAAPDVDADNFANLTESIEKIAKGVTLYAAANDRALIISRNFWRKPRAGDVTAAGPLILPGIQTIDVTAASTDTLAMNHSGYAENNDLLQDIGKLILDGLRPPEDRLPVLKRVATPRGEYWRYTVP